MAVLWLTYKFYESLTMIFMEILVPIVNVILDLWAVVTRVTLPNFNLSENNYSGG